MKFIGSDEQIQKAAEIVMDILMILDKEVKARESEIEWLRKKGRDTFRAMRAFNDARNLRTYIRTTKSVKAVDVIKHTQKFQAWLMDDGFLCDTLEIHTAWETVTGDLFNVA